MALSLVQDLDTNDNGTTAGETITVTFTATATIGNLLVSGLVVQNTASSIVRPSGWTALHDTLSGSSPGTTIAWAYKVAGGAETAAVWSWTGEERHSTWFGEWSGNSASPLDVKVEGTEQTTGSTQTCVSGTSAETAQADSLAIFFAGLRLDQGWDAPGGRSYTTDYSELVFLNPTGSNLPVMAIATKPLSSTGTQACTLTTTDAGSRNWGALAVFKASSGVVIPVFDRHMRAMR